MSTFQTICDWITAIAYIGIILCLLYFPVGFAVVNIVEGAEKFINWVKNLIEE